MSKKLIVVADFGDSKLKIATAFKRSDNSLELIDIQEEKHDREIKNGLVINTNNFLLKINELLDRTEKKCGINIGAYTFGIEPHTMHSNIKSFSASTSGSLEQKLRALKQQAEDYSLSKSRTNIETREIEAKFGSVVSGDFLLVSVGNQAFSKIEKLQTNISSKRRASYKISQLVEADTLLSDEDKQKGALFIDLGAGCTSFVAYKNGFAQLCNVLPIGSKHITTDIAHKFGIDNTLAEQLKIQYGYASEEFIVEPKNLKIRNINSEEIIIGTTEVSEIIRYRVEEIINFVFTTLNLNDFGNGVYICGGGAKLNALPEFINKITELKVERLQPKIVEGTSGITKFDLEDMLLYSLLTDCSEDCMGEEEKPVKKVEKKPSQKKPNKFTQFFGKGLFDEDNEHKL